MSVSFPVADHYGLNRILLVKLSSLGDIVHALPLLEALRAGLGKQAHIAWAIRGKFAELLEGNPFLDAVYPLEDSSPESILRFGKTLRNQRFDVTLDTQGLLVSGFITRLSGAPLRIGMDANREGNAFFLTHPVVGAKQRIHMVDKLMGFCNAVGIPPLPVAPQIYLVEGAKRAASALLSEAERKGPVIGCIVGASTPEKTYPALQWVEVARQLANQGAQVVLLGGTKEATVAAEITAQSNGAVAINLVGKTPVRTLASTLALCDIIVGGDSGPTHLAVSVGTPVVGLYGVTDPVRTGPQWGSGLSLVLDYAEKDAPPETRRPRHSSLTDALSRIPSKAVSDAAMELLRRASVEKAS
jgi:lipopolysaccharide heptosyltransferase I